MKQMHIFKSVEYYSSPLAVIAFSKNSLPAVQICSWGSSGAIRPKTLAKPPIPLLSATLFSLSFKLVHGTGLSALLQFSWQKGGPVCCPLFRKPYFITAQGTASQQGVNSQTI